MKLLDAPNVVGIERDWDKCAGTEFNYRGFEGLCGQSGHSDLKTIDNIDIQ